MLLIGSQTILKTGTSSIVTNWIAFAWLFRRTSSLVTLYVEKTIYKWRFYLDMVLLLDFIKRTRNTQIII